MQIKILIFIIFFEFFFSGIITERRAKRKNSGGETAFTRTEFALFTGSIFKKPIKPRQRSGATPRSGTFAAKKWQTYKDSTEGGARTSRSAATATSNK